MKKILKVMVVLLLLFLLLPINGNIKSDSTKKVIKLKVGNKVATVDGQELELDAPPQITNGRTMVPVRFISEGLGAEVAWDGNTKTVTITMDSIDYLKLQVENLQKELSKKNDEATQKNDQIEELQTKVNNLENQKVKVNTVATFKTIVDSKWTDLTNSFTSTDECLYAGTSIEMLADTTYNLSLNIYDPYGNLVYNTKWEKVEHKKGEKWSYRTNKYNIKDYLIGAIPGTWKVKVLIDDKPVGLSKFTVKKDENYKVNKVDLTEVVTCKNVVDGNPQDTTQTFSKADERAIIFTRYKALTNCGFRVKYKFYNPQGDFYTELFSDIKSLEKDKETWYWGSIKIKGFTPEKNPGEWKCKIYVDDDIIKEVTFNIS